jgi:hypothetical protein
MKHHMLALALAACAGEPALGAEDQEVRLDHLESDVTFPQVALAADGSLAARSSAYYTTPILNNNGFQLRVPSNRPPPFPTEYLVRRTCGATFIAPHFAVTSSRCLPPGQTDVLLSAVDLSTVHEIDRPLLLDSTEVDGTFPNYVPTTGDFPDEVDGFVRRDLACRVVSHCTESNSGSRCQARADIALLYCPERPATSAWLPIAATDPQTGPIEMFWYHEVLDMPSGPGQVGTPTRERFDHYTSADGPPDANFHNLDSRTNVLLPLKAIPRAGTSSPPPQRLGDNLANPFACEGTEGSGVLQAGRGGRLELLGPVVFLWINPSRLCGDTNVGQLPESVEYAANDQVRLLEAQFGHVLNADRIAGPPDVTL